jgi:hypothetical protein
MIKATTANAVVVLARDVLLGLHRGQKAAILPFAVFGGVAQRESGCFASSGSGVQIPSPPPRRKAVQDSKKHPPSTVGVLIFAGEM